MRFFTREKFTADPDYDSVGAGLFEGGRAYFEGRPLWLHAGCGQTLASDDQPGLEHEGCDEPGMWHPVMVPVGAVTRPPTDLDYLERRTAAALRLGPGNTSMRRVYRWRHKGTGSDLAQLDAQLNPGDYTREVCVEGVSRTRWVQVPG